MRELALHVLDVLENSLEAGATEISLVINEDLPGDKLSILVQDNGRGMDEATLQRVLDPFFTTRTTRHVGLGLPLLAAAARRCDGDLVLDSAPGRGTTLTTTFRHSHIDRAPLGDMAGTLLAFLLGDRGDALHLSYRHLRNGREFALDTAALHAELDGVPLSHPLVRDWLQDYLVEGEAELAAAHEPAAAAINAESSKGETE